MVARAERRWVSLVVSGSVLASVACGDDSEDQVETGSAAVTIDEVAVEAPIDTANPWWWAAPWSCQRKRSTAET